MRKPAALAALLALGWPARCLAEPLKVFNGLGTVLVVVAGVGLALIGLPALVLLARHGGRRRGGPPEQGRWPELTAERCALLQEACRSRGLHLQGLVSGPLGLSLTVAAGTQAFELKATAAEGLGGEALQDALVQSALGRIDALRVLLGGGASG
jgi:hypothetical protein